MLRVLLACLALVALARAANPTTKYCNLTITCVNQGGACDLENGEECAEGLYCDTTGDKTCKAAATLGNDCSGTGFQCWNADYELTCDALGDKTCKYAAIYGPGEACSSDTTDYLNGGCVLGSCVSGKCTGSGNGDACDGKNCTVGLYCTTNGTCAARKTEGTSCASSIECQAGLYCATKGTNAGKCATPFQGASGDACDVDQTFDGVYLDCGANLWCSGGSCASLTGSDGSDCSDDGTCPDNQGCVCHVDKSGNTVTIDGPGTCKLATVNPKSLLNDLKSFESCALNNNCFDLTGSGIVGLNHGGPNQCIAQCINSVGTEFAKLGETFNKCDLNAIIAGAGGSGSGSSAAIFPSFVAIVALFVYAIFA